MAAWESQEVLSQGGRELHLEKSPGLPWVWGSGREQGQQEEADWLGCCLRLGPGQWGVVWGDAVKIKEYSWKELARLNRWLNL